MYKRTVFKRILIWYFWTFHPGRISNRLGRPTDRRPKNRLDIIVFVSCSFTMFTFWNHFVYILKSIENYGTPQLSPDSTESRTL